MLICLGALVLRLFVLQFVHHPGVADPNHYYNLGIRLMNGQGFTIDYIWNYFHPPLSMVHPEDHWMPLTGVLAATGMTLFGQNVHAALFTFIVIGAFLVPLLAYAAARQVELTEHTSLFCAAMAAALPEFVLNSVRTDTTIPNVMLGCTSIVLLIHGFRSGRWWSFVGSGVAAGLSYLTRNDGLLLLPMFLVTIVVYWRWGRSSVKGWRFVLLAPLAALIIVTPWLLYIAQVSGASSQSGLSAMFFYTEVRDHWTYGGEFTLQTMLASQTIPQLIGKRLFELAAAFKLMYTTLDIFLPVAVAAGVWLLLRARDRERWLRLTPLLILLVGCLLAYPLLIPLKSQSGSFKKAYLTLIPLLLPFAGFALEKAISDLRIRAGIMLLAVAFTAANAVELVRADARFTNAYLDSMQKVAQAVQTLPDTNGDGQITLMAQDQFMLAFLGVPSIMIPMENRDMILEVAARYGSDYLMMPPDRPTLDPLYNGDETDARFIPVLSVKGTNVVLYKFDFTAVAS